jgi:hypothetical protein
MAEKTRRELEDAIIRKSVENQEFRAALLADARKAVESALAETSPGATLPANLKVKAIEEPQDSLYIVVPANPEVSDRDLEHVAGGDWELGVNAKISGGKKDPPPKKMESP